MCNLDMKQNFRLSIKGMFVNYKFAKQYDEWKERSEMNEATGI